MDLDKVNVNRGEDNKKITCCEFKKVKEVTSNTG